MCTFKYPDGGHCARDNVPLQNSCTLHYGWDVSPDEPPPTNPHFQADFDHLTAAKEGNWRGFVFPRGTRLPKVIDYPVQAQGCQFVDLYIEDTRFTDAVDFTGSVFRNATAFRGTVFGGETTFAQCRFLGQTDFLHVKFLQATSFHRAIFSGQTILRVYFSGSANLNETVFRDAVTVTGWRNITMQLQGGVLGITGGLAIIGNTQYPLTLMARIKSILTRAQDSTRRVWQRISKLATHPPKRLISLYNALRRRYSRDDPNSTDYNVFGGEGHLESVLFGKPEHASFTQVDLSKVYLRGTNLRGVRFLVACNS